MSKSLELLEIEKCIASRLWYTASAILTTEIKSHYLANYTRDDIQQFQELIKTTLIVSENREQYEWISHKLLLWLDKRSSVNTKEKLLCIQFQLNLKLINNEIPELIKKELLELFETFASNKQDDVCTNEILTKSFEFLESSLITKPALTCWFVNDLLLIWPTSFISSDSILQDVYSNSLKVILTKDADNKYLNELLCILSKLNLTETKEDELLTWLYSNLLKKYNYDYVELALYSRKNIKFLKEWHNFMDDTHFRLLPPNKIENVMKISNVIFSTNSNIKYEAFLNTKELTLRVARRKMHWLQDIMDICFVLLENLEYDKITKLLSYPMLANLWPSVLLYYLHNLPHIQITDDLETWQKNFNIWESLKFLLKISFFTQYENNDPIPINLRTCLINRLTIIKCILDYRKKQISSCTDQNLSVKKILNDLQNFCILTVIQRSIDIYECAPIEVEFLLKDREDNIRVYRCFWAMLIAMKAILKCEPCTVQTKETTNNYYTELESLLNIINPLSLRMEVIQNIFSMLFLRQDVHFNVFENSSEEEDCGLSLSEKEKHSSAYESKDSEIPKRCGFICNYESVKNLLQHLKQCLFQVGIDFAKFRRETVNGQDVELIQKNIFAINNAITDAFWRLELLASPNFINRNDSDNLSFDNHCYNDDKLSFPCRLNRKFIFYKQLNKSSSEDSERDRKSDIEGVSETSSTDTSNKRRKKSKNSTFPVEGKPLKITHSKFIINLMLASKESLVLRCLWKGDYARAQQIIELFSLKNTQLDGQVRLSKAMQHFRVEVMKQNNSFESIHTFTKKTEESRILENIRRAAQGGYQTSRLAGQLETFLISQESNSQIFSSDSIGAREILTLCVLDLALTVDKNEQVSMSFLEVALKYLKLDQKLESTGYIEYFQNVYRHACEIGLNTSLPKTLCDATISLRTDKWKERKEFWCELLKSTNQFLNSQSVIHHDSNQVSLTGDKYFREILGLCRTSQTYLHRIYAHLQILLTIFPDGEKITNRSETMLLNNPLVSYFGHQLFNLNIEPESLEVVANKLGVDLVYIVLVNCCPKLTCYSPLSTVKSDTWGYIVLNKNHNNDIPSDHKSQDPNQCVADILLELCQTIKLLYPDCARILNKDLNDLAKDPDIQRILQKSSILESLELSELSVGDHTLAFFLNLWNLLFLHTLLTIWLTDPPLNSLSHFLSLSSINYHIGDLGLISLLTLRSKLLGSLSWDSEFFSPTEDINEVAWQDLDLVHDPRVIFAMINEFHLTPMVHIYYPQTINDDLNQKMSEFLNFYCKNEVESSNEDSNKDDEAKACNVEYPNLMHQYENYLKKQTLTASEYNNPDHIEMCENNLSNNIDKSNQEICKLDPAINAYDIVMRYENVNTTIKIDQALKKNIQLNTENTLCSSSIKPNILHYLEEHCWILSYLVKRVHNETVQMLKSDCDNLQRTACFENNLNSTWISTLANVLFDGNSTLASVHENLSLNKLWVYLEKCIKNDQLEECLNIINALPNKLLMKCIQLQCLKDKILCHLMCNITDANIILKYIYQIKDINVLAKAIISNINKWPINVCQDALFHVLHHNDKNNLPSYCTHKMKETLCRVTVFYKMLPYCKNNELALSVVTWNDVVNCTEKTDPGFIIQSLIEADKFELCLEWLEYQTFSLEIQSLISQDLLNGLLKNDEADFKNARKLLAALPTRQSIKMCKSVLKRTESIRVMKFIIDYLLEVSDGEKSVVYYKAQIGVEILDQLEIKERVHYMHLVKEPLLMLEQLLMNCKFDNLRKIINVLQRSDNVQKADISIEQFDKIVRFYAGKSLDFRVSLQRDNVDWKAKDSIVSTASSDSEGRDTEFVMPINVPAKEDWIPNDKARECSCCKTVIFSMFNRRHHCRRCGRVVCASCSQQRMQVAGYPKSILVRVCDDCKKQTVLQMQNAQGSTSTASSLALECWKLTTDETHNQTVRDEFSFEHAPNISLCLAILSLHSDHKVYASFILDRCDEMKKLLQPVTGGKVNPEIDHGLIIQMIRTLLVAVKMKCAKLGLNAGLAHCDRFLSQVDLIATLVQSDCLALIPSDDSVDEHALRKLRDLLTEKEQWTLALDVSTKAGLETQGVWAAWGKACLKVGYLERARTKFAHCLEKVSCENPDDWVLLSFADSEYTSRSSEDSIESQKQRKSDDTPNRKRQMAKSRPHKDPPLLLEILQILENQSQLNPEQSHYLKSNVAHEILITINSLKAISQGQCNFVHNWNSKNIYYDESLYYLMTYGSSNSILEFFVKHEEFNKCLIFVMDNNVDPEVFFNAIYLRCLNMGTAEKLLNVMRSDDPTLMTWKKYLVYVCHCLDKKQFFHTLYNLQLFMSDFIRAAMTCIRFYKNDARNYIDLCSNSHYLIDAQRHLETELNVLSLYKKRRKSIGSTHSGNHGGLTMEMEPLEIDKHMNTISRQLEVSKFLGNAEKEGRTVRPYLKHLLDTDTETGHIEELPTLFGNQQQKTRLAVLAILCGRNIEEGFGIAFRIMQDYNLRTQKVYSLAGHVLALEKKIDSIEQLTKCCRSSGAPDAQTISDRVLTHCVKLLLQSPQNESTYEFSDRIDYLIRLINDVELKVSSYIESKQLKAAYLLAVKHQRVQDIRKILKEADRLGQTAIRSICIKWLKQTQNSL